MNQVFVIGAGVISAIGNSYSECLSSLMHCRSGIAALTTLDSIHKGKLPVGEVKLSNEALAEATGGNPALTRTALLGLHAAQEAVKDSKLPDLGAWRVGLLSATTVGGMDKTEMFFPAFMQDSKAGKLKNVVHHACGSTTEIMAGYLGVKDFITTINTACSSSVNAIMMGARMIRHNLLDIAIAGGTDALTRFTINGFNSLMILDDEPCKPFDANRKGLNLGEGAGYLVLASERVIGNLQLNPKAIISGYANTNDAYHQTASSPEGNGSYAAMKNALAMADLKSSDIDYINLHGTGTKNNDLSEGTAVKRLFGEQYPRLSSTKAYTGHTLGASGGVEAVFSVMAIDNQCVFPNLRFKTAMPELGVQPQMEMQKTNVNHVMSNSFGFGGNCASIILSSFKS